MLFLPGNNVFSDKINDGEGEHGLTVLLNRIGTVYKYNQENPNMQAPRPFYLIFAALAGSS